MHPIAPCLRNFALISYGLIIFSGAVTVPVQATPPSDPICAAPNSLKVVEALRLRMAGQSAGRRAGLRAQQIDPSARLSIERGTGDPFRLVLSGSAGKSYDLEATPTFGPSDWKSLLTLNMSTGSFAWSDPALALAPAQFFRLRSADPEGASDFASTFRLLDAQGVAHDLYYHSEAEAVVVLSAGTNLDAVKAYAPLLKEVSDTYSNRVQTWILLSDGAAIRSNVWAQAKNLNLNVPVLFDTQGLAARSVGLNRVGEAAVVRPPEFTVAYRGQVAGSEPYLRSALAALTRNESIIVRRTAASGSLLNHVFASTPDYSAEVAPILQQYCAKCHQVNGVAPFALTNFSVLQEWSTSIKHALLSRRMPPWHADPEYGQFTGDLALPEELRSKLVRWIDAGAPRGNGPDPLAESPAPAAYTEWPADLGEPDALVTIPVQQIKATGTEAYRYIPVRAPNPTNVWLRAAIIRPSNYKPVHHYFVFLGQTTTYDAHIAEFVPGYKSRRFPEDSGILLGKSNWLTFNMHYNTYGIATNDQPVLALWYHKTRPKKTWGVEGVVNNSFVIRPGASDHPVQAEWEISSPVTIYRFNPHMHLRGKRMKFDVAYPGGARETLLSVPDYDFNWQIGYDLAQPKLLPAGSRVIVSGAFDNSTQNLANPNASLSVRWGEQSYEEMFIGYIDYTK